MPITKINDILQATAHRPFPLPQRPWKYVQEWHDVLMLHWQIPTSEIADLLPNGLIPDTIQGSAWISLFLFSVKNTRPRYLPPVIHLSDFYEANLRTYVIKDGKPAIYFFSVEASKGLCAMLIRNFIGLPYIKSKIDKRLNRYSLKNKKMQHAVNVRYLQLEDIYQKSALDLWLTERYCVYQLENNNMYEYNIHHQEWPLKKAKIQKLQIDYRYKNIHLSDTKPDEKHFASSLRVLLWGKKKC